MFNGRCQLVPLLRFVSQHVGVQRLKIVIVICAVERRLVDGIDHPAEFILSRFCEFRRLPGWVNSNDVGGPTHFVILSQYVCVSTNFFFGK